MMDYEVFKEVAVQKMPEFLFGNCAGREVISYPTQKVNETLDMLSIKPINGVDETIPVLYLNSMYDLYLANESLETTLHEAAEVFSVAMERGREYANSVDLNNAREKVVFQLINTEQNKELLEGLPHREWQDLSVIYRLFIKEDYAGISTCMVTDSLAKKMGVTEEELFKLAAENTRRIFPPTVKSMKEVLWEMYEKKGMPEELIDLMVDDAPENDRMFVISNTKNMNGAVSMLYENKLYELALRMESDLFILPSSVHETIAVPAREGDAEKLAAMVSEINMAKVDLKDRLSNQVYLYDKDLRRLSLATDTPNKRLDGKAVAEPALIYEPKERSR